MAQWNIASKTHRGKVRPLNEDAMIVRGDYPLVAVADGMGGHESGDVASTLICDELRELDLPPALDQAANELEAAILRSNSRLLTYATQSKGGRVVGSTVLAMLAREGRGICLWAGDSRLYRARNQELEQLSADHSYVGELVRSGHLSPDEARHHPSSNIITRAVGTDPELSIEQIQFEILAGDVFLLCTDGLYQEVDDDELLAGMLNPDLQAGAEQLLQLCLGRAARDNITLVLARSEAA